MKILNSNSISCYQIILNDESSDGDENLEDDLDADLSGFTVDQNVRPNFRKLN